MSWREMNLSLQLAAEERAGYNLRRAQREQRAIEDAAMAGLRGAVRET